MSIKDQDYVHFLKTSCAENLLWKDTESVGASGGGYAFRQKETTLRYRQ